MAARHRRASPKLAAWLKGHRENRPEGTRSFRSVANQLKTWEIAVSPSTLFRYEDEHRMPTADVLWALAQLYGESSDVLVGLALGRDLPRHSAEVQRTSQPGGAIDPAVATRLLDLEGELAALKRTHAIELREIRYVTGRLVRIVERAGAEGGAVSAAPSGRRRRHRGTS